MAVLTDLSFEQLQAEFDSDGDVFFVGEDTLGNLGVMISLTVLSGGPIEDLTSTGVVKAVSRLLDLCRKAQTTANQSLQSGERLNAFPTPVSNGTLADGYIEVTEALKSRIVVASATEIIGAPEQTTSSASTPSSSSEIA